MSESNSRSITADCPEVRWHWRVIACVVIGLAVGIIMWMADTNAALVKDVPAKGSYYNLLVDGFRAGHLSLNREPPPKLAQMSDPYNPTLNSGVIDPVNDLSYYQGKLYMYFGVTPALVLYWPWVALTGHYVSDRTAMAVFFAIGLALMAGLLIDIRRRCFPETGPWTPGTAVLSMGLMLGLTLPGNVYDVAVTCGFAFIMIALAALWRALREPQQGAFWLALASLALGLAIGSRPTLLFSIILLLFPIVQVYRQTPGFPGKAGLLLAGAAGPALGVGLGLMIYNDLRFGNPFEFGWHYQLIRDYDPTKAHQFSLNYFWFNFQSYFLVPFEWKGSYPFLHDLSPSHMPAGYSPGSVGVGGAIWCRYPLVWLILALPLARTVNQGQPASSLHRFMAGLFWLFISAAFVVCLFLTESSRYELDFLPALLILAVVGFLGVERATSGSRFRRTAARAVWCFLLACSIGFSMLINVEGHAVAHYFCGNMLASQNRFDAAIMEFQKALALWPDCLDARDGIGNALLKEGRLGEAIVQYQKVIALEPQSAGAHERYGDALFQKGQPNDAMREYQKAVELKPDFGRAHENLGTCFAKAGQLDQAIIEYQRAVEVQPDLMASYYSLGNVFRLKGMTAEAVTNYQKAIELKPDLVPAQVNLAEVLATSRDPGVRNVDRAITLMENANRAANGRDPQVLRALATAYAEAGRFSEAITTAQNALIIATAESNGLLIKKLEKEIQGYQARSPRVSAGN